MKALILILVLWEAPDVTDMGIAMAEPVEGMPAEACKRTAEEWNTDGDVYAFCLPEGNEPTP